RNGESRMWHSGLLPVLLALPFAAALIAALLSPNARNAEAWLAGLAAVAGLLLTISAFPAVTDGKVMRHTIDWVPALGLSLSLRLDGFAWLFCLLITGIGLLVVIYARYYMPQKDPVARFYALLLAFMGAMLGVVISGNLILIAVFWELTSIFSFLLIGYWHHNQGARDGARMALTITGTGGLCLLVGMVLIGQIVG